MELQFENRRKFHRINYDGVADLEFIDNKYDCCQIKNLSLTGMYVKGNFQQEQVKNCNIKLFHNDGSGNNGLRASGEVVWSNDDGAGVKFTKMPFESYMILMTTLINNADRPSIILYEFPKNSPYELTSA